MPKLKALFIAIIDLFNIIKPLLDWWRGGRVELNKENLLSELSKVESKMAEEQAWLDAFEEMKKQEAGKRESKAQLRGIRSTIVGVLQMLETKEQIASAPLSETKAEEPPKKGK